MGHMKNVKGQHIVMYVMWMIYSRDIGSDGFSLHQKNLDADIVEVVDKDELQQINGDTVHLRQPLHEWIEIARGSILAEEPLDMEKRKKG